MAKCRFRMHCSLSFRSPLLLAAFFNVRRASARLSRPWLTLSRVAQLAPGSRALLGSQANSVHMLSRAFLVLFSCFASITFFSPFATAATEPFIALFGRLFRSQRLDLVGADSRLTPLLLARRISSVTWRRTALGRSSAVLRLTRPDYVCARHSRRGGWENMKIKIDFNDLMLPGFNIMKYK